MGLSEIKSYSNEIKKKDNMHEKIKNLFGTYKKRLARACLNKWR